MNDHFVPTIESRLRILQMIVGAMIIGLVLAAVVFALNLPTTPTFGPSLRIVLLIVTSALIAFCIGVRFIVRRNALQQPRTDNDVSPQQVFNQFFILILTTAAILEGACLFGLIVFLLSGDQIDLAIAAVPFAIMILLAFPTRGRWQNLLADAKNQRH